MIHGSIDYRGNTVDAIHKNYAKKFKRKFLVKAHSLSIFDLSVEYSLMNNLDSTDQIIISQDDVPGYTDPKDLLELFTWVDAQMKKVGFASITPYVMLSNDKEDPCIYQFFKETPPTLRIMKLESEKVWAWAFSKFS